MSPVEEKGMRFDARKQEVSPGTLNRSLRLEQFARWYEEVEWIDETTEFLG